MAQPKSGKTAKILLNVEQIETLASIGCTLAEIANFFKCSIDTLSRNYADALSRGREAGKVSVRRMMWDQGKKGNSTALKYLVHNILKEKIEEYNQAPAFSPQIDDLMKQLSGVSTAAILKIVKDHEDKVS